MNLNNDKLNVIQQLEYNLIYNVNCGSYSTLFTKFMHSTSEWIDKESNAKEIHISPYKQQLDKDVKLIAYYIESGMITDDALKLAGIDKSGFYDRINDTHKLVLNAARKKRKHNRNY